MKQTKEQLVAALSNKQVLELIALCELRHHLEEDDMGDIDYLRDVLVDYSEAENIESFLKGE